MSQQAKEYASFLKQSGYYSDSEIVQKVCSCYPDVSNEDVGFYLYQLKEPYSTNVHLTHAEENRKDIQKSKFGFISIVLAAIGIFIFTPVMGAIAIVMALIGFGLDYKRKNAVIGLIIGIIDIIIYMVSLSMIVNAFNI